MIKHIVCFKLKNKENKEKAKEILLSMEGNVKTIKHIEVGVDFLLSNRSYDVILIVSLLSKSDLSIYQNDSYHVNIVKKYMHEVIENSISVDYEV